MPLPLKPDLQKMDITGWGKPFSRLIAKEGLPITEMNVPVWGKPWWGIGDDFGDNFDLSNYLPWDSELWDTSTG